MRSNTGLLIGLGVVGLGVAGIAIASASPKNGGGGGTPFQPLPPSNGEKSMEGNVNYWPLQSWRQMVGISLDPAMHPLVLVAFGPNSNEAVVQAVQGVLGGVAYTTPKVNFSSIFFGEIASAAEQLNGQLTFSSNAVKYAIVGSASPQGPITMIEHTDADISNDTIQQELYEAVNGALQRSAMGSIASNIPRALVRF